MDEHEEHRYVPPMDAYWDPYDDDRMAEAAYLMEMDHYEQHLPTHVARLFRRHPSVVPAYVDPVEKVVISAYSSVRLIVFTYPRVALVAGGEPVGCVREVPVGWRDMASIHTFAACFDRHVDGMLAQGWRKATGWNQP